MSNSPTAADASGDQPVAEAPPVLARVLVIDDEEIDRWTLERLLKAKGYDVATAASGEEGVELLRCRPFEVAIADLMMPGMGGLGAMAALKGVAPDIEVILMTGHATVDSTVAALRQGACDYLVKPIDRNLLFPAIARALARRRPKAALPMYESSRRLRANLDRDGLIPAVLELSQQMLGADAAALALSVNEGAGLSIHFSDEMAPFARARVEDWARRVFAARGPLCDSICTDSTPKTDGPIPPAGSAVVYPLEVRNVMLGALVLWRSSGAPQFSAFDVDRGKLLVDEISIALDNARLYRQLNRKIEEVEAAKREAAQAEARSRAVIETAREVIVLFDKNGVIHGFNPVAEETFGLTREQALGRSLADFAIPSYLTEVFKTHLETAYREGRDPARGSIEVLALRQNGEEFPFEISTAVIETPQGKLLSTFGRDITERRGAERALQESEAKLQAIFDGVKTGILVIDPETHKIVDANPLALELVGARRDRVIGSVCHKFVCPADQGKCPATDLGQIVDESERTLLTVSGEKRSIIKTVRPVRISGRNLLLESFVDITARKQAEQKLLLTQYSIEHASDAVTWLDSQGRIVYVNEETCRSLGWSREELLSSTIYDINPDFPPGGWVEEWERMKRLGSATFEAHHLDKRGRIFPVEVMANYQELGGEAYLFTFARNITERKEVEQRMHLQATALEAASNGIVITDQQGQIQWANPAFSILTGYELCEVLGQNHRILKSGMQDDKFYGKLWGKIKSGEVWHGEMVNRRKDGSLYTEEMTITPVRDCTQAITHYIAIKQDVTERIRAREELLLKQALMEAEAECTIDGILVVDQAGQVLQVNKRLVEIMGLPQDIATTKDDRRILEYVSNKVKDPDSFVERVKYYYAHAWERARDEIELKDGKVLDRYSAPLQNAEGRNYGRVWYFRDITERKRAEEALRESEERFRRIAETITEVFWTASSDVSRMLYISPGYEQIWGRSVSSLYANPRSFLESIHPQDVDRILRNLSAQHRGEPFNHEYRITKPDGTVRWIWDRGFPVRDESGQISCYVGVAQDITDRKLTEEALRESELRFRRLTESNIVGIFVGNNLGEVVESNTAFLQMLGYGEKGMRAGTMDWRSLTPPEYQAENERIRRQLATSGVSSPVETEFFRRDGTRLPAVLGLVALDGSATRALGFVLDLTDLRHAERALEERTVYLNTLFEISPMGIVVLDTEGRIQMSNSAFEKLFLYSRQDIAGAKLDDFIVPEDLLSDAKSLTGLCLSGPGASLTSTRRRKDGTLIDVDIYGVPLFIEGQLRGVLALYQDITDRKRAEADLVRYAEDLEVSKAAQEEHAEELARLVEELARERDLLGTVMDNIPDGIYYKDCQCRILRVNPVIAKTVGLADPRDSVGKTDFDFFPEEDAKAYFADEQQVIQTGRPLIGRIEKVRQADGQYRWHSTSTVPIRDAQGRVIGLVGITRDMTEDLQAEERLKASEERYRELFENASDIVYTTGLDTRLTSLNNVGQEFLGYTAEEATELDLLRLVSPKHWDIVRRGRERLLAGESDLTLEVEVVRKDGRPATLEVKPRVILKSGEPVGVQGIARDVTGRDEAELELRHTQKLESVGRLAAGIAHEINTPIQFVGDNTRFLQDSFTGLQSLLTKYQQLRDAAEAGKVSAELVAEVRGMEEEADCEYLLEEIPKALAQTLEGVTRVATIVRAMKEFAHPESKEMAAADLNRALQSTLTVARNELKYVADVVTDFGDLPLVVCNVGDMNQVFLNLLVNAAHAITEVEKDRGGRGKIQVRTRCEEKSILVSISDSGAGIPESIRGRIFDPFFTTKEVGRGTGQGLAIARSVVVDRHKGTLTFESEVGKGTTFYVRLPMDPSHLEEEKVS